MRNFIFSLIAALIFVGAAAKPAQALGETRAELNIGNQSDKCAYIYVAYNNQHNAGKPGYQSAWLKPGQSHVMVFYSNTFNGSIKWTPLSRIVIPSEKSCGDTTTYR